MWNTGIYMHPWKKCSSVAGLVQSVLMITDSVFVDFAYLQPPNQYLAALLPSSVDMHRTVRNVSYPTHTCPAGREQCNVLPRSSSLTANKCSLYYLVSAVFFIFLCPLLGDFAFFNMALKDQHWIVSSKRLRWAFWKKYVLDKLASDRTCGAAHHGLNSNESTVYVK